MKEAQDAEEKKQREAEGGKPDVDEDEDEDEDEEDAADKPETGVVCVYYITL